MENIQQSNCIAPEKLRQLIADKKKEVKIIDVRSKEEYNEGHIPEAMNIEITQLEMAENLFDKTEYIITTCGKGGGRSTQAVTILKEMGFKNANWLCGGTFGWNKHA